MTLTANSYIGYVIQYAIAQLQATAQFLALAPIPSQQTVRSIGGYNTQGDLPTSATSMAGTPINFQAGLTFAAVVHGEEFPTEEIALYTFSHNGVVNIQLYIPVSQITTGASDQLEYVRTIASTIAEQVQALFGQPGYLARGTCYPKSHSVYDGTSDLASLGYALLQLDWHSP